MNEANKEITRQIFLDTDEYKQTEEAVKHSEELFRTVVESAPYAMILVDQTGKIVFVNSQTEKYFGYGREELIGQSVDILVPEGFRQTHKNHRSEFSKKPETRRVGVGRDLWALRKDGVEFPVEIGLTALQTGHEFQVLASIIDISERKQAEEQRQRLLSILGEKNKELEQIISVISHDLRSPLVNIQGFSKELLAACSELNSLLGNGKISVKIENELIPLLKKDIPESLFIICSSVAKMDSLLKGSLRLSRLGHLAVKINKLNMNNLISSVARTYEYQLRQENVRLEIENLPDCFGDDLQITQVFDNLIGNALKYLQEGRPGKIKVSGEIKGNECIYCVQDNGGGIPESHKEKIFEIFYRHNPRSMSGEGLGLTIVQRILSKQNGRIWVDSLPGIGSKFFVALSKTKFEPTIF